MRQLLYILALLLACSAFAREGVLVGSANMNNRIGSAYDDTTGKDTLAMGVVPSGFFHRGNEDHLGWIRFVAGGGTYPQIDTLRWWFQESPYNERRDNAHYDTDSDNPSVPDWAVATDINYVLTSNAMWIRLEHPDSLATGDHIVTGQDHELLLEVSWVDTTTTDVVANRDSGYWEAEIEYYFDDAEYQVADWLERLDQIFRNGNASMERLVRNTKDLRKGP